MSTKPYKWEKAIFDQDPEWWDPYNKVGRLKGKGTTSRARQERRAAETSQERAERIRKREEDKKKNEEGAGASSSKGVVSEKEAQESQAKAVSEKEAQVKKGNKMHTAFWNVF